MKDVTYSFHGVETLLLLSFLGTSAERVSADADRAGRGSGKTRAGLRWLPITIV